MIPKIFHQIWVGDKSKMPIKHIQTWITKHPDYEHIIWDEEKIDKLNLINRDKYDIYYKQKCYHGASDIVRIEILYNYGGVYLDSDSICNNSIDDLLDTDFFAVYSPNIKGRVGNAFFGSTPNHEILKIYIDEILNMKNIIPPWNTVGGTKFGEVLKFLNKMDKVLPPHTFYTEDKNGKQIIQKGKNYCSHYWGTTHKIY